MWGLRQFNGSSTGKLPDGARAGCYEGYPARVDPDTAMTRRKTQAPMVAVPNLSGGPNNLTLAQVWFCAWRSVPKHERDPWGRTELAKRLGIGRTTTYDWERNPQILAAVKVLSRRHAESEYGLVIGAVIREAIAGSVAHARLYFELMGDLGQEAIAAAFGRGEASVQNVNVAVLGDVTFDQRRLEVNPEIANRIAAAGDGHDPGSG